MAFDRRYHFRHQMRLQDPLRILHTRIRNPPRHPYVAKAIKDNGEIREFRDQTLGKRCILTCDYSTPAWMHIAVVTKCWCRWKIIPWKFPLLSTFLVSALSLLTESEVLRSKFTFPIIAFTPTASDPAKSQF